jgi:hypothetical protein
VSPPVPYLHRGVTKSICSLHIVFVYLVGLTPKLKQPYIANPLPPYQYHDFKRPLDRESFSASTLTYASWDRIPEKTGEGGLPPYSSNGFADSYYYRLQSKTPSPARPRPPSISKSPMMIPNPSMTPQSTFSELGRDEPSDPLRPYTPLSDSHARSKSRLRGSASSLASLSSYKSSDSDLEELKRAVIAPQTVPYAELVRRGSGEGNILSLPRGAQAPRLPSPGDILPPPFITLTDTDLMESRKSVVFSGTKDDVSIIPHKVKRKAPPQQLSLGNQIEFLNDGGFSAVPRSPSPISPGMGSTLPAVPNSGALPSHPRLTMHFREMKMAHSQSPTVAPNVRNLTP